MHHLCLSLQADEPYKLTEEQIAGKYLFCLHNNGHIRGSRGGGGGTGGLERRNTGLDPFENHKTFQTTLNVRPS